MSSLHMTVNGSKRLILYRCSKTTNPFILLIVMSSTLAHHGTVIKKQNKHHKQTLCVSNRAANNTFPVAERFTGDKGSCLRSAQIKRLKCFLEQVLLWSNSLSYTWRSRVCARTHPSIVWTHTYTHNHSYTNWETIHLNVSLTKAVFSHWLQRVGFVLWQVEVYVSYRYGGQLSLQAKWKKSFFSVYSSYSPNSY